MSSQQVGWASSFNRHRYDDDIEEGPNRMSIIFHISCSVQFRIWACNETSALIQSSHKYLIKGRRLDCVCIFTLLRFLPVGIHYVELANYPHPLKCCTDNGRGKVTQHPGNSLLQQKQFMQREKFYEQIIPDEMECVWVEWWMLRDDLVAEREILC